MSIHLANAIYYITDGEKAQDDILVGNHNCNAYTDLQEMLVKLYKVELNKENERTINLYFYRKK